MCAFLVSAMYATCLAHLILLSLITQIIFAVAGIAHLV